MDWSPTKLPQPLSRRELLAIGLNAPFLDLLGSADLSVAAEPALASLPPLNHFPRMVQDYFVEQVRNVEQSGLKTRAALKTKADAETYIHSVRKKIATCFRPFPHKTPLNAKITGKVDRDDYVIERVIFESRPGFLVTANLYVPKRRKFPLPGVVGSCGHSNNGKAEPAYQSFAQALAIMGYVVLIFDPIGQGERLQYGHLDVKTRPRIGVGEHLHAGNQQFLVGEFFGFMQFTRSCSIARMPAKRRLTCSGFSTG